ncbi:uncharacterized protein LOC142108192 isoform X2 [Mixophyes fleayi]|uniref:uncharacterized protein LOC142108192 isoform X2 n=1 Tax=Mixophyes fleayi TaxID=3061075 RepID=UPI003F4DD13A
MAFILFKIVILATVLIFWTDERPFRTGDDEKTSDPDFLQPNVIPRRPVLSKVMVAGTCFMFIALAGGLWLFIRVYTKYKKQFLTTEEELWAGTRKFKPHFEDGELQSVNLPELETNVGKLGNIRDSEDDGNNGEDNGVVPEERKGIRHLLNTPISGRGDDATTTNKIANTKEETEQDKVYQEDRREIRERKNIKTEKNLEKAGKMEKLRGKFKEELNKKKEVKDKVARQIKEKKQQIKDKFKGKPKANGTAEGETKYKGKKKAAVKKAKQTVTDIKEKSQKLKLQAKQLKLKTAKLTQLKVKKIKIPKLKKIKMPNIKKIKIKKRNFFKKK